MTMTIAGRAKTHKVVRLDCVSFAVTSGTSGKPYEVTLIEEHRATCTCLFGARGGQCSHILAARWAQC